MIKTMRLDGVVLAMTLLGATGFRAEAQTAPAASQAPAQTSQAPAAGSRTTTQSGSSDAAPAQAPADASQAPAPAAGGQFPAPGQVMPELHVEPVRRPGAVPQETQPEMRQRSVPVDATPGQGAPQLLQRERYRVHEGDQLSVQFTFTPEFNQAVTVQPDGYVTLLVGGDVKFAGHTLDEIKAMVEQSVSVRLKDPVVTLTLTDFQRPYFVVAGEALTPQKYEMREHLTVLQGLMLSGGIRQTGAEKQVVLIHGLGTADQQLSLLNLKDMESNKIFEHDMDLASGDIIFVPRNKLTRAIQIMQLVNSPVGYANALVYASR